MITARSINENVSRDLLKSRVHGRDLSLAALPNFASFTQRKERKPAVFFDHSAIQFQLETEPQADLPIFNDTPQKNLESSKCYNT